MGASSEPSEIIGSGIISALHLSQQASAILGQDSKANPTLPTSSTGTAEEYGKLERLFFACLHTGDDYSAQACLDRLSRRFGSQNGKVIALHGLYKEATAKDQSALDKCLEEYDQILLEEPANVPVMKRRVALLHSLNRTSDAITALVKLLDAIPTDAEAWCELADLYQTQGLQSQGIFCLEEALLIAPNAWNIHARLGELLYVCSSSLDGDALRLLGKSVQHFCRSVELCDDYLRGFYGLALASSHMLHNQYDVENSSDPALPSKVTLIRLKSFALQRLGEILLARPVDDQHWASSRTELTAAKELLNRLEQGQ